MYHEWDLKPHLKPCTVQTGRDADHFLPGQVGDTVSAINGESMRNLTVLSA